MYLNRVSQIFTPWKSSNEYYENEYSDFVETLREQMDGTDLSEVELHNGSKFKTTEINNRGGTCDCCGRFNMSNVKSVILFNITEKPIREIW